MLHLQPGITLLPHDSEPLPLSLVSVKPSAVEMIDRALASRPEMKQHASLVLAARDAKNGAVYGPLIPTLGGYAFAGGFGGGAKGGPHEFGGSEDYSATLFWRVGPGGLFDFGQIHAKQSRMRSAEITAEKVRDRIAMEVVTARARVLSLSDQVATAKRMLDDAAESYRLDMQRKAFDVGIVLETITAEQEVTRSRNDYLAIVAEYDKAQYELLRALGSLNADVSRRGASK
jgi:outer membrane protein TolC